MNIAFFFSFSLLGWVGGCVCSWHLLNDTIDELLRINPRCIVVSSVERRAADGIDEFLCEMRDMENVGGVEKVWSEEGRQIEIYVTRGRS